MAALAQKTLVGWKAIAGYFSRDERTVMRWAAQRGMPVQRVAGQARSSVYAWPEELDAWLRRTDPLEAVPAVVTEDPAERSAPEDVAVAPSLRAGHRKLARLVVMVIAGALCVAAIGMALGAMRQAPGTSGVVTPPLAAARTFHDPAARAAFLQASFDWNLRTRESLERAVGEFGDAVSRDPGVAASYVGLANTYLLLREYAAMPDAEAYHRAAGAARVAVSLSPESMEARRALAFIAFWWNGDIVEARRQFGEAVALAPDDALTHHWFATALSANGERQAALREISTARSLDPGSSSILVDYGQIAYLAGRREEGRRVLGRLVHVDPDDASLYRTLATIALFERRYPDYLKAAARSAALRNDTADVAEIARQTEDYRTGRAPLMFERMVDAARDRTRRTGTGFFRLAQVSAISGRTVAAIDALAPACTNHDHDAIAAPGDLWLASAIDASTVQRLCGRQSLDGSPQSAR